MAIVNMFAALGFGAAQILVTSEQEF
jgi:hypothetical protein